MYSSALAAGLRGDPEGEDEAEEESVAASKPRPTMTSLLVAEEGLGSLRLEGGGVKGVLLLI